MSERLSLITETEEQSTSAPPDDPNTMEESNQEQPRPEGDPRPEDLHPEEGTEDITPAPEQEVAYLTLLQTNRYVTSHR